MSIFGAGRLNLRGRGLLDVGLSVLFGQRTLEDTLVRFRG